MEGIRKKLVKKGQTATNTPLFGGDLVQTVHVKKKSKFLKSILNIPSKIFFDFFVPKPGWTPVGGGGGPTCGHFPKGHTQNPF